MSVKERPTFFDCKCGEHFVVDVTPSMKSEARSINSTHETDTTDARSSERSEEDSEFGKLAEVVVKQFFEEHGASVRMNDGWVYDLEIDGRTVEVKARDYTQTSSYYADLLVRDREDTSWSPDDVDIIIQVMLKGKNSDKAYITGYCTGKTAANADIFDRAKTHRTRKVPHNQLQSIENLL